MKTKTGKKKKNPYDVTSAATEPPARIRPGAVAGCEQQGAALRQLLWPLMDFFFFFSPLVGKGCFDHFYHAGRCWINMHASRLHRLLSL